MDGTSARRGSAGGKARAAKLSPERRSAIARMASEVKWERRREDEPSPGAGPTVKAVVALRLPGPTMAELVALARDEDRSLSWLATRAVKELLAKLAAGKKGDRPGSG